MTLPSTAHSALVTLASGAEGGHEESANYTPYITGIGALAALMLLLWITTRFNRDR
ncbi:hypothetical protein [Streptomyces sp. HNM0574]|uniref:hypothetical protein n=1 Tax=Streptomyces sp. HNM0574 TaxID=2714954 RepID=UPI00146ADDCD|nr:hypothetical protein [Streptomyces sp. HNM0574]NLU69106.1 hypothetical protein [Streptomyces sp. HNM0574]